MKLNETKLKGVFLVIAVVSAVLIFAVWSSLVQSRVQLIEEVSIESGDCSFRLQTSKLNYTVGERIPVRLFQKNNINESIQGGISEIILRVVDTNGKEIMFLVGCPNWRSDFRIDPGEEKELKLNLGWSQKDWQGNQVPPGIYTLGYAFGTLDNLHELRIKIEDK